MIRILIITDDRGKWINKIIENVCLADITNYKSETIIKTADLFYFRIIDNVNKNYGGDRFSNIIVDKCIDRNILYRYVSPYVMQNTWYTSKYYEECENNDEFMNTFITTEVKK